MADIQRQGNAKPQTWQDGVTVSNALAVGDGTRAEALAALGYGWDATSGTWVKLTTDHTSGALNVNPVGVDLSTVTKTFANVAASQTDAVIVTAVVSKKIRVLAFAAVCGASATTLVFNSKPAGAGTAISMTFQNAANGGEVLPLNPVGWFDTNTAEGLSATTGSGATTGLQVIYTVL